MSKKTLSLYKLETLIKKNAQIVAPEFSKTIPSFRIAPDLNEEYIKPTFSIENSQTSINDNKLPKILLISAAGATGKSELTKYLMSTLKMPVFDLSLHPPVGSNSLTGLLFETMGGEGLASYIQDLKQGKGAMVIDALDEGHMKTTVGAFESFLEGIVDIAKDAVATPFILLGRTNIIESSFFYLIDRCIETEILYIEPFTIDQAKSFIDTKVGTLPSLNQQYREVRDYIIESIDGFFKNESDIANSESRNFIGYAPVLLSISVLLRKNANYQALLMNLKNQGYKNIKLVLDVINLILTRDKNEKVLPIIKEQLFNNRSEEFIKEIETIAYSNKEQCARSLYHILNQEYIANIIDDNGFNLKYNELVKGFQKEHPFVQDGKLQNVVFESYVLASLMLFPEYENDVLNYMRTKYKSNFMLFFIYEALSTTRQINLKYLQYLYSSLKSLDNKNEYWGMSIQSIEDEVSEDKEIECSVEFYNKYNNQSFTFTVNIHRNDELKFDSIVSNLDIVAPIKISLGSNKIVLIPPVFISCNELIVNASELVIEDRSDYNDLTIEADFFKVDYSSNQVPQIIRYGKNINLRIICNKKPDFPFSDFYSDASHDLAGLDENLYNTLNDNEKEKYLRLRMFLMQFRSHSKGDLAKLKDKIEHIRIVKNDEGRKVLEKLKETDVFYLDGHLYKINVEKKDKHIGLPYIALKRKVVNSKTSAFIKSIK